MELTAADINALIAANRKSRGTASVGIDDTALQAQFSIPLQRLDVPFRNALGLGNRYLNATVTIIAPPGTNASSVQLSEVTLNGHGIPAGLLDWRITRNRKIATNLRDQICQPVWSDGWRNQGRQSNLAHQRPLIALATEVCMGTNFSREREDFSLAIGGLKKLDMNKDQTNLWAGLSDEARNALTARDYHAGSLAQRVAYLGVDASELASGRPFKAKVKRAWIPGVEIFPRKIHSQRHRGVFGEFVRRDEGVLAKIGFWPKQWSAARMFAPSAKGFHVHPPSIPADTPPRIGCAACSCEDPRIIRCAATMTSNGTSCFFCRDALK